MGKKFAFTLSLVDMIRKICYRYEHPFDYATGLTEHTYEHRSPLNIDIDEHFIKIDTPTQFNPELMDGIRNGNILDISGVLPPISEYELVTIESGNTSIIIDEDRNVECNTLEEVVEGTKISIMREQNPDHNEEQRATRNFGASNRAVTINDEYKGADLDKVFNFDIDGIVGTIRYNPKTSGSNYYFNKGRFHRHFAHIQVLQFLHYPTLLRMEQASLLFFFFLI